MQVAVPGAVRKCDTVVQTRPRVECSTTPRPVQLQEICLDIAVQLPREECVTAEKKECRLEPSEVVVQRCEPTVREECGVTQETVCQEKCKLYTDQTNLAVTRPACQYLIIGYSDQDISILPTCPRLA